jgi:hypothetical protein
MQIELTQGEDKIQKIMDLLSANQQYYHGCIIYINNEIAANTLKKKLDSNTKMNTKIINHVKGAELFWSEVAKRSLKNVIVVINA